MSIDTNKMSAEEYAAHTGKMSYPAGVVEAVKDAFLPLKPLLEQELSGQERLATKKPTHASPEEWDDELSRLEKNAKERAVERKSQGERMSDKVDEMWDRVTARAEAAEAKFKPGQTVWMKGESAGRPKGEIVAISERYKTACVRWTDDSLSVRGLDCFTATDPNAKSTPQKCPFCGSYAELLNEQEGRPFGDGAFCMVRCSLPASCGFEGPFRKTSEEAIAAWNRLCLRDES